jgi:hypothetical protein
MATRKSTVLIAAFGITLAASAAWAKLPPPPPVDEATKAAAAEKKAKDAEQAKADLEAAQERAVKNYHANMKKAGKPIPKPTPIAAAAKPGDAKAAPEKGAEKGAKKS